MNARKDIVLDVENLTVDIPVSAGLAHPWADLQRGARRDAVHRRRIRVR